MEWELVTDELDPRRFSLHVQRHTSQTSDSAVFPNNDLYANDNDEALDETDAESARRLNFFIKTVLAS